MKKLNQQQSKMNFLSFPWNKNINIDHKWNIWVTQQRHSLSQTKLAPMAYLGCEIDTKETSLASSFP